MKVGGAADYYVMPRSEQAVIGVIDLLHERQVPYCLIGAGTNILVGDGGFRGAVVAVGKGLDAVYIEADRGVVTAGAGASLSVVAKRAAKAGLSGLEPISGIPGTVGGALYMNAGAYGGEMSRVVIQARIYDLEKRRIKVMNLYEMRLGYRSSVFQSNGAYTILSVMFSLGRRDIEAIHSDMRKFARRRNAKQPMDLPSAGSFFKRPEGDYAGALIEAAGLKGLRAGGASVSEKHAGFIVNTGGATAADVTDLMRKIQDRVYDHSGNRLEPEPIIIGEDA
jgi:UDP-N-acetylmuramate dehydrogenase